MAEPHSRAVAALFPGQGAFDGEALLAAAAHHPEIGAVFAEIDEVTAPLTGRKLSDVVLGGPVTIATLLEDEPWVSQLAIYGVDVAVHRVLSAAGLRADVMVGHSLGEIAALSCAGVFTVADGARVIWHRVAAIGSVDQRGGYMAALSTDPVRAGHLVALIGDESLAVAVENHRGQTVVSGSGAAMDLVCEVARGLKISVARLDSPVPYHCPLLAPAVDRFADAVRAISASPGHTQVYSPILGRCYTAEDDLGQSLALHLVRPVRFAASVRALYQQGVRVFVESGALGALGKLVTRVLDEADSDADAVVVPGLTVADNPVGPALRALRAAGVLIPDSAVLAALFPQTASSDGFASFWADRGPVIVDMLRREYTAYLEGHAPAGAIVGEPSRTPTPSASPTSAMSPLEPSAPQGWTGSSESLAGELRGLYADALEYPEEVFTDDVLLEADLGIDSVKQVELFSQVSERYGLPPRPEGFRLSDYSTMGKVIDYVQSMIHKTHGHQGT
jgi:malonyl CoA-acyl carrier protein transacylase/acyl carrier protein